MFIRITACWLADSLWRSLLHQGLRTFHRFHARLGCYRLERKLPDGFNTLPLEFCAFPRRTQTRSKSHRQNLVPLQGLEPSEFPDIGEQIAQAKGLARVHGPMLRAYSSAENITTNQPPRSVFVVFLQRQKGKKSAINPDFCI